MRSSRVFRLFGLILALTSAAAFGQTDKPPADRPDAPHTVGIHNLRVHLSDRGEIVGMDVGDKLTPVEAAANTQIGECREMGQTTHRPIAGGGVAFTRTLARPSDGRPFTVTETFTPASNSIRWEVEITDAGGPWSAPIQTVLRYPAGEKTRLWSAWADPRNGSLASKPREELIVQGIVPRAQESGNWADPLVPIEPLDATLSYGAPPYTYEKPQLHIIPDHHDVFCLPLVSLMEPEADTAVSLVLCPEDLILDLTLTTGRDGTARFDRLFHRIGKGQTLRFRMDLVCHAADPRAAIGWMHRRYADFFLPPNPRAHDIAGTGSYSNATEFDEQKMRDMAYKVYWRASFDFPYMGMFLPPVGPDVPWNSFRNVMTSIDEMSRFSKSMRERGFHVLSYFNVTEFGTAVKFPPSESFDVPDDKLWTDSNAFLYTKLREAMLMVPEKQTSLAPRYKPGEPFWTWCAAVAMDPGEPVYRDFLLEQARRHIEMLPADDGICIDRMDWLRMYNLDRDDGVSWFDNKPARSLRVSWRDLMDRLGPLMHAADKTIFCNNHDKRIEILRHADGIYDEFTNSGRALNTIAMLGVTKPVMGWTNHADEMQPDADAFFQKYLYMGVFPMAPFSGNDHSIQPTPWVERQHLDYGPLMKLMRHKQWVLRPHCVEAPDANAKVNLFRVADGFVVPVVYAGDATEVRVKLGRFAHVAQTRDLTIRAVQPGVKDSVEVHHRWVGDDLEVTVPVHRGCAMVHLRIGN